MSQTAIELQPLRELATSQRPSLERPSQALLRSKRDVSPAPLQRISTNESRSVDSKSKTAIIITAIAMVTGISTLLNGLVTVILPTLSKDLKLANSLLLWPTSIQALTCGCTLLLAGSVADVVGARIMFLIGTFFQVVFVLGCGLARTGTEMIVFRGLAGIALSLCLPSAVSIITGTFVGRRRNLAFATMGGSFPLGFTVGTVLGGILTDTVGWRTGFYISAAIIAVNLALIFWALPASEQDRAPWSQKRPRLIADIDWMGAALASISLALFSYVFV